MRTERERRMMMTVTSPLLSHRWTQRPTTTLTKTSVHPSKKPWHSSIPFGRTRNRLRSKLPTSNDSSPRRKERPRATYVNYSYPRQRPHRNEQRVDGPLSLQNESQDTATPTKNSSALGRPLPKLNICPLPKSATSPRGRTQLSYQTRWRIDTVTATV